MKTLQQLIDSKSSLVDYFYNDTISQYHKSRTSLFATLIAPEYTNWREEQKAWREAAVLFNQSHHMPVLYVKGPDARKLLNYLSPCSFENLSTDRSKQYIACTPRGHHIGDCILNYYGEQEGFELISGMPILNWVRYNGETGGYNVEFKFDPTTPYTADGKRTKYRFQLEGPNARAILDEVCEGGWPEIKFFHTAYVTIAGCKVHVLRHGMAAMRALKFPDLSPKWTRFGMPFSKPVRSTASSRPERGRIIARRWKMGGFRIRSPASIPEKSFVRIANG